MPSVSAIIVVSEPLLAGTTLATYAGRVQGRRVQVETRTGLVSRLGQVRVRNGLRSPDGTTGNRIRIVTHPS